SSLCNLCVLCVSVVVQHARRNTPQRHKEHRGRTEKSKGQTENTMKKFLFLATIIIALVPLNAFAQAGHEYSPVVEKTVNYKNWSLLNLQTDKPEDLRALVAGKKLVMVVYFAPWCGNWRNEAPIAAKLYEKYKDRGFQVVGVSEYAARADVKAFFGEAG